MQRQCSYAQSYDDYLPREIQISEIFLTPVRNGQALGVGLVSTFLQKGSEDPWLHDP